MVDRDAGIKVGCCGFAVSQKDYFRLFKLIEIQNTFYQLPRLSTAEKWRETAPPGFEFTLKAWQLITHEPLSPTYRRLREKIEPARFNRYGRFRATAEVLDAWSRTATFARALGSSVIVFQSPASFRPTDQNVDNITAFFSGIDREGFHFTWEPRGRWPQALVLRLCEDLDLIHCVDPFKNMPVYGDFQYLRLHGNTGYSYRFTDQDLERLRGWVEKNPTYILFNNNWMKEDALRFRALVHCGR